MHNFAFCVLYFNFRKAKVAEDLLQEVKNEFDTYMKETIKMRNK